MYAKKQGAPASRDPNMLKVENPYFDKDSKLPTNTTNLMPQRLQKRAKGGHKGFGAPSAPKGKGKGSLMTRPHSDGFLQDMMTPMGLHNMSDVQQYRKLVEMRNQDIMNKREDEILRQYQHVTQGIMDQDKTRLLTGTGAANAVANLPADATPMERSIHRAVQQTTRRGKRDLETAGAQVAGKPFMPRRGGQGGYVVSGSEPTGARIDQVLFRHPRRKGKGKGKGGADDE